MLTVTVLLGFALVAGLFVYLTVRDAGKWRAKLEHILLPIGFLPVLSKPEKAALGEQLAIVNPGHPGRRLVKHLYRRESAHGEYQVFVCDTYFASASGKARGGNWLLVGLTSNTLHLPHFCVQTAGAGGAVANRMFNALSQLFDVPGLQRLRTGDAQLDDQVQVHAEPGLAHPPLAPAMLRELRDCAGGTSLYAHADMLVLNSLGVLADRMRQVLDTQKLQAQIQLATRIYSAVKA
jgi:hypothetical protein